MCAFHNYSPLWWWFGPVSVHRPAYTEVSSTLLNALFSIFTPLCSMFYDNALFKMQKYIGDFSIGNSLSRICLLTWRLKTKFLNSEDFLFEATYNEIELEFHSKQIWFSRAYFVRTARLQLFCGYLCVCVC